MNLFFILLSFFIGVTAFISSFQGMSYYLKRFYRKIFTQDQIKKQEERLNNWWDKSFDLSPKDYLKVSALSSRRLFINKNMKLTGVLFYSTLCTLLSVIAGELVTTVLMFNNLVDEEFRKTVTVESDSGTHENSLIGILILYENAYYGLLILCAAIILFISLLWLWKKNKTFFVIYAILTLLMPTSFIVSSLRMLMRYQIGLEHYFDPATNYIIVFNLIACYLLIRYAKHIKTIPSFILISIGLFLLNNAFLKLLDYNSTALHFYYNKVGVVQQIIMLYGINFLFDILTIWVIDFALKKIHTKYGLLKYYVLALFGSLILSALTYISFTNYLYQGSDLYYLSIDSGYLNYLTALIKSGLSVGDFTLYFYALSSFLPILISVVLSITIFFKQLTRKKISLLTFYVYSLSNNEDKLSVAIIPYYMLCLFISFLVGVGLFLGAYIGFLEYLH